MTEKKRITRDIHNFGRGNLNLEQSLKLLDEIVDYYYWLNQLETDMIIYSIASFSNPNSSD